MKKERYCFRCNHKVKKETNRELKKEYPYYCPYCDENMYSFETYTKEQKNTTKKYKWNKKKCFKNLLYVVGIILIGIMFAFIFLDFIGIDIVF